MTRADKGPSDRSFGITLAAFFTLVAVWPWAIHGRSPHYWALVAAILFGGFASAAPRVLSPLNRIWFVLGTTLHHIVNPFVMALIYYGAVVPTGLLVKATGKDLLRLKRDSEAESYWIARDPPGPDPRSMAKQF